MAKKKVLHYRILTDEKAIQLKCNVTPSMLTADEKADIDFYKSMGFELKLFERAESKASAKGLTKEKFKTMFADNAELIIKMTVASANGSFISFRKYYPNEIEEAAQSMTEADIAKKKKNFEAIFEKLTEQQKKYMNDALKAAKTDETTLEALANNIMMCRNTKKAAELRQKAAEAKTAEAKKKTAKAE